MCEKLSTWRVLCFFSRKTRNARLDTCCTQLEPRYSKASRNKDRRVLKFKLRGTVNLHLHGTVGSLVAQPISYIKLPPFPSSLNDCHTDYPKPQTFARYCRLSCCATNFLYQASSFSFFFERLPHRLPQTQPQKRNQHMHKLWWFALNLT